MDDVRFFVFFFQAEDGIRDYKVTGVQTCALPILRRACRARRLGVPGAPDLDALLARTRSLPPETARLTARAFTVFFILINAAEQAHRVRRSRQDDLAAAQRGSVRWSL